MLGNGDKGILMKYPANRKCKSSYKWENYWEYNLSILV